MRRVITYGTYDLLHHGHIRLLQRARDLGDYLVVALSTDQFNTIKHKSSLYRYKERKIIIESIRFVDLVIPERSWNQKISDVKKYSIDVFVMGSDWAGEFDFLREYCEVVYLPRTPEVSTSSTKLRLRK